MRSVVISRCRVNKSLLFESVDGPNFATIFDAFELPVVEYPRFATLPPPVFFMVNTKKCVGKDAFQRLNYLYQITNETATQSPSEHTASIHYSNLLINVSKKTVQRLDIGIKRTICKKCRTLLLAGITSKVRIRKKQLVHTCMTCKTPKVFDVQNRQYLLWSQQKESIEQILNYSPTGKNSQEKKLNIN
ncbi:ribonuclease P protein subunit p21-like [Cylas formicarius]|uniref:ribonuclease P protein subunit p21-like n=1 Tax=Cylas formicarius TaxID=197179 RepID=UPI0029588858|nr:ribonuclease P protein subunit p21-like [Cylas formicarius]